MSINDQTPICFFITENMIGDDFGAIKRCYDLKGSLYDRITKVSTFEMMTGETGFKVLKDQNFINQAERLQVEAETKEKIIKTLRKDSELLRKHGLIDYSVFLVQVDRSKRLHSNKHEL